MPRSRTPLRITTVLRRLAPLGGILVAAGCATTRPQVVNDTGRPLRSVDSEHHAFRFVRIHAQDGELWVYGTVEHRHGDCAAEPAVNLEITDAATQQTHVESLPLRTASPKQHGWYGASFRTRREMSPGGISEVQLSFLDAECGSAPSLSRR